MSAGNQYIPVGANAVMPMAEGASGEGGYHVDGGYINWDIDGITGQNWPSSDSNYGSVAYNPFGNLTEQEIIDKITNGDGTLDDLFLDWGSKYTDLQQLSFIVWAGGIYGDSEQGGCVGARL